MSEIKIKTDEYYSLLGMAIDAKKLQMELNKIVKNLKKQKSPCSTQCFYHLTHPCEKCGRIQGYLPEIWSLLNKDSLQEKSDTRELKMNQWFLTTLKDVFTYNEYSLIDLALIEKCLNKWEDCDPFTKKDFEKIYLELLESGLALLPTTNKAIKVNLEKHE